MHIAMAILVFVDMPDLFHHDMTLGQSPIIVDLSEVKIDEFTNLPAKAEFGPEDRKATVEEKPKEQYDQETQPEPEPEPEPEPVEEPKAQEPEPKPEPVSSEVKQDFLAPPEPVKKPEPKKEEPKPTPKKPPVPSAKPKPKPKPKPTPEPKKPTKPQEQNNVKNNALRSLMRELNNNRNVDIGETTQSAMIKEGTQVNHMGIEGGNSEGSYFSDLTISETDAIASLLSQNWNLDPGAIGMENMVVPIRVHLARDGSIQKIEFIERSRFNSDTSYQQVARSAERAIIMTQQAFKEVFGVKYSDRYDSWKTIKLNFDPLDKGIR